MNIGLILHPYDEEKPAGLGRALFSLTKNLIEADVDNFYTIFVKGAGKNIPDIKGDNWEMISLPKHALWLDAGLRKNKRRDLYIFFTPFMPFFFNPKKSIVVAHDFGYRYIKARHIKDKIRNTLVGHIHARSLKRATHVVSVTEDTKKEIVKLFNISEQKITTIYNGFTPVCNTQERIGEGKYFLFVGVIKERKNVLSLVQAYAFFYKKFNGKKEIPKLFVVGKGSGNYYNEIIRCIKENNLVKKVELKGYVSDADMEAYYKNAFAFVFPSLIEGFGLPILEAMQCGVSVVTSNRGALKEVAGDAALLVDPTSIESIASGFEKILRESGLREKLIEKGVARSKEFSWEKAVKKYSQLIKNLYE